MSFQESQTVPSSCWDNDIKFVLEVRARPCLYDMSTKRYKAAAARQKAWESTAEVMQIPVSACTTRWKTIRDRYVRVYRRSGSGADEVIEDPSWMVCKYLSFINSSIKPKRTSGNYPEFPFQTLNASEPLLEITREEEDEPDTQTSSSSGGATPIPECPEDAVETENIRPQASTSTASPATLSNTGTGDLMQQASTPTLSTCDTVQQASSPTANNTVTPGKRKRTQQSNVERMLHAMAAPVVLQATGPALQAPQAPQAPQTEGHVSHFLQSLKEDMESFSPSALRRLKIRILQVIEEEAEKNST